MISPFLAFLGASVLSGGLTPIFVRYAVIDVPPLTVTAIRFLGAAFILFFLWFPKREMIKGKDILKVIPFMFNMGLYSIGLQYTSVTMGSILYAVVPILVAILGYFLLAEKLSRNHIMGLTLSIAGIFLLLKGSIETNNLLSFGMPLGNVIILLAVFFWSFYLVGSRSLSKKYSSITILFFAFFVGSIGLTVLSFFEWRVRPFLLSSLTPRSIWSLVGLILLSVFGYILYQWLIKHTSAFIASLIQYGVVVFASIAGVIVFQERATFQLLLGALLVIFGVFLATTYQTIQKHRRSKAVLQ